jgi:hypothetical protein
MASPLTSTFKHLRGDDDCSVLPPPYATRPPTQSGNRKTGVRTAALFDRVFAQTVVIAKKFSGTAGVPIPKA